MQPLPNNLKNIVVAIMYFPTKNKMKNLIGFLSCLFLFSCGRQDQLIGTWERIGDDLKGMRIEIMKTNATYRGKIIQLALNDSLLPFAIGDVKWQNIRNTSSDKYDYEDLQKYQDEYGSLFENKYRASYIKINNDTIETRAFSKGGEIIGTSQIWVKVLE